MRLLAFVIVVLALLLGFMLTRPGAGPPRDRYRVAEERIEAERARGRLDKGQVEQLRLALRMVREGIDTPRYKIVRGDVLESATAERSVCRITVLTPWLDEVIGVQECNFSSR